MAIQRNLPSTVNADSTTGNVTPTRTGPYLEAYTFPLFSGKMQPFADEGSYFTTYNVTDGTGIAGHVAPVQADLSLKPLLHIFNGSSTKRLYPDFVRIRFTAIGAGATTTDFHVWVDANGSTVKTSGGTVATVVNCLGGGAADGDSVISFGPVVATAATSEKRLDHQRVRSVVPVVEDQIVFTFGNPGYGLASSMATTGTNQGVIFVHFPPVVVPALGNFKLGEWGASQSGAHSFEYTVGYVRR
jgi:hypothetical protein